MPREQRCIRDRVTSAGAGWHVRFFDAAPGREERLSASYPET
jgi:hypothetical protein